MDPLADPLMMKQGSISGSEPVTLVPSQPDITVTDVAGARYWLAGGAQDVGVIFHYVPVNKFSRESPAKLFCDNHLKTTVAAATG